MTTLQTAVHDPPPVEKIAVEARRWQALQRQVLRMTMAMRAVEVQSAEILASCKHAEGCDAHPDFVKTCLPSCPDRERALSAVVCLRSALQFTVGVTLPNKLGEYTIPQREYFDAIVAELEMRRAASDALEQVMRDSAKFKALVPELADAEPDYTAAPRTRLLPAPEEVAEEPEEAS